MKKAISTLLCMCILASVLSACGGLFNNEKYTLMVYMVGSDLESKTMAASNDLTEMLESKFDASRINLLVFTGGSQMWYTDVPNDANATFLIKDDEGGKKMELLQKNDASLSMGDPKTLSSFLNYAHENYAADHYGLICWDHGSGPLIGFGKDKLFKGDSLELGEMEQAMGDSPFKVEEKLDFIGFDACLMSSVEVANALSPYADYMIASQETEPGDGWNYAFLDSMNDSFEPKTIAQSVIDTYHQHYEEKKSETFNPDLTLACLDLTKIDVMTEAMNKMFSAMNDSLDKGSYQRRAQERSTVKTFGNSSAGTKGWSLDLVDMNDMAQRCADDFPEESAALQSALGEFVAVNKTNLTNACGISIYYPYDGSQVYASVGAEKYKSFDGSDSYLNYMEAYTRTWSEEWLKPDNTVDEHTGKIDDTAATDDKITVTLTDEQKQNFSKAYINIYRIINSYKDTSDNTYTPVLYMSEVKPDGDGNISISKDEKVPVINGVSPFAMKQLSKDESRSTYVSLFTEVSCNDGNMLGYKTKPHPVSLYCSGENNSDDLTITSVEYANDDDDSDEDEVKRSVSTGKTTIDADRWSLLRNTLYQGKIKRDSNGAVLPFSGWDIYGGLYNQKPIDSMLNIKMTPLSKVRYDSGEFYYQVVVADTLGKRYYSELKSFENKAEAPVKEEKTPKGKLTYKLYDNYAVVVKYEGEDAELTIPEKYDSLPVTEIESEAFKSLSESKRIADVIKIENPDFNFRATVDFGNFKKVILPDGLKTIPNEALTRLTNVEELVIPDSVESLGSLAFGGVIYEELKLKELSLPENLSYIGYGAFWNCDFKDKVSFRGKSENNYFKIEDNLLLTKDGKKLIACLDPAVKDLKIPEGVEEIYPYVHAGSDSDGIFLTSVEFPSTLRKIGFVAFYDEQIEELVFPDSLTEIGNYAFFGHGRHSQKEEQTSSGDAPGFSDFSLSLSEDVHVFREIRFGKNLRWLGETIIGEEIYDKLTVSEENRYFSVRDNRLTNKSGDTDLSEIALSSSDNLAQNEKEYKAYAHATKSMDVSRYAAPTEKRYNKKFKGNDYSLELTMKEEEQKKESYSVDNHFTLMGKEFALPCMYSEVEALGLTYADDDVPTEIKGGSFDHVTLRDKDKNRVTVSLENKSEDPKKLAECYVTGFSVYSQNGKCIDFGYKGIGGDSSVQDVIAALGAPTEMRIIGRIIDYTFTAYSSEEYSFFNDEVEIEFYYDADTDTAVLNSIEVKCYGKS